MSFVPTHRAPATGAETWPSPDSALDNGPPLEAHLPVAVVGRWGDWAEVECSNGWRAWVDGRHLVAMASPRSAPAVRSGVGSVADAVDPLAFAGGAAVVLAAFLPWLRGGGASADAFDVVAEILVSLDAGPGGLKLGVVLLVLGLGAVAVSRVEVPDQARLTVGSVLVLVPVIYTVQLQRLLGRGPDVPGAPGLVDSLGIGVVVALAGGAAVVASGWRGVRR